MNSILHAAYTLHSPPGEGGRGRGLARITELWFTQCRTPAAQIRVEVCTRRSPPGKLALPPQTAAGGVRRPRGLRHKGTRDSNRSEDPRTLIPPLELRLPAGGVRGGWARAERARGELGRLLGPAFLSPALGESLELASCSLSATTSNNSNGICFSGLPATGGGEKPDRECSWRSKRGCVACSARS